MLSDETIAQVMRMVGEYGDACAVLGDDYRSEEDYYTAGNMRTHFLEQIEKVLRGQEESAFIQDDFAKAVALRIAGEMNITSGKCVIQLASHIGNTAGFVAEITDAYHKPVMFFAIERGERYSSDLLSTQPDWAINLINMMLNKNVLPKELIGLKLQTVPRTNAKGYRDVFVPREVK